MCTFRAFGIDFDVDAFLSASTMGSCAVHHAGEPKFSSKPDGPRWTGSGFNADVSTKEWNDLPGQIEDAKVFLRTHDAEIRRLGAFCGCEAMSLDFPMNLRIGTDDIAVQWDTFPAALLLLAGTLGVDITFTIYPPSDD